jgi:hypothetical protein
MVQRYAHLSGEHLRVWVGRSGLQLVVGTPADNSLPGATSWFRHTQGKTPPLGFAVSKLSDGFFLGIW